MAELLSVQPPPANERGFQAWVLSVAKLLGWRVAHFRPARTAKGWRTPVAADGKGFPDLVLVKHRTLFVELKTDKGKEAPEQVYWRCALRYAGQEAVVWRPSMWREIVAVLGGGEV